MWPKLEPRREVEDDEVCVEDEEMAPPTAVPARAGKGVCSPQAGTGVPISGLSRSTFSRLEK